MGYNECKAKMDIMTIRQKGYESGKMGYNEWYMKPINTEWQYQISHKHARCVSITVVISSRAICQKNQVILSKYLPENRDHWWSLQSLWQNWCSMVKRISRAFCYVTMRSYVDMVINHWYVCQGLWLVIDLT